MPIDPSIPLNAQAPQPNINALLPLIQYAQQKKQQNAISQILNNPNSIDPATGLPTQQAAAQIMKIDPKTGLALQEKSADLQEARQEGQVKQAALYGGIVKKRQDAFANLLQDRIDQFGLDKAVEMSKSDYRDELDGLVSDGLPKDMVAKFPQELSPAMAQKVVAGALTPEQRAEEKDKTKTREFNEKKLTDEESDKSATRGLETRRLDLEGKRLDAEQGKEPLAEYKVKGPDGKETTVLAERKGGKWIDANGKPVEGEVVGKPTAAQQTAPALDLNDPHDKDYITAIANYKIAPPTSGRNPEYRKQVLEAAREINPDFNETKYQASAKAQRDFGTGKQGDIARSLNVSVSHLQSLRDLGAALDNGDVKLVNAAKQRFAEEFGVPAPTNFDAAKSIVADEVAKGVIGGASAQSDRETLAASLRKSGSPATINGAIDTFQGLLGGQLKGLRDQYKRTTGSTDFDDEFLSDTTRKTLEGDKKTKSDNDKSSSSDKTTKRFKYDAQGNLVAQ